ncbi:MAG: hypothetical protein RBJ76_03670 [Stenomitos frigidus ULC029]
MNQSDRSVNQQGDITLIGVTQPLVNVVINVEGKHLGGFIDYTDALSQCSHLIAAVGH